METKFDKAINFIRDAIKNSFTYKDKTYLVGGVVRDKYMNIPIKDIDLMIDMPQGGIAFATYMVNKYDGICKNLVIYPRFGTAKFTLIIDGENVDIECVMPRSEGYERGSRKPIDVKYTSLHEDALRRDFTVNALYMRLDSGDIIDPLGRGIFDIDKKILRTPTNPYDTFTDDPLRMLRCIRFMCTKHFEIETDTLDAIEYCNRYLSNISIERINDELSKILCSDAPTKGIDLIMDTGLYHYIIPELGDLYFKQYSKYHDKDVMGHTLSVLEKVQPILSHRLAALLHDIAKPYYHQDFYENGEIVKRQFIGHDVRSAEISEKILKNLRYSNDVINEVCFAIRYHMILKQHVDKDFNLKMKDSTCRKIHRTILEYYDTVLDLIDADNKSHALEYCLPNQIIQFTNLVKKLNIKQEKRKLPINGNDIMEYFHSDPSEKIKQYLEKAEEIYDIHPDIDKNNMLKLLTKKIKN